MTSMIHLLVFGEHDAYLYYSSVAQDALPTSNVCCSAGDMWYQEMNIVVLRLSRVEPLLQKEVMEYMKDHVDSHM